MQLDGKDLRTLPGALSIYLHVPFARVEKTRLDVQSEKVLESIYSRVEEVRRKATEYCRDSDYEAQIAKELSCSTEIEFDSGELRLISIVLKEVIDEDTPTRSHNVYFNGDPYGIVLEDFEDLLARVIGAAG